MDARTEPQPTDRYQVGDLLVDPLCQSVSRAGVDIPLPRLSYELLLSLVQAHPRMLSNEDLLNRVWGRTVVNLETVSQRVKLLRHALGDDPQEPRYIATVRGRGYRLVAPVHAVPQVAPALPREEIPPPPPAQDRGTAPQTRARLSPGIAGGICVALVIIAAAGLVWRNHRTGPPAIIAPLVPRAIAVGASSRAAPPENAIAVLPFLDLSENKNEGYMADGVTDEVTSVLAQVPALRVSARTSAYAFKDKRATVAEIGSALGVAHVLEGSVRVAGDRIRVTAQLVRTDTGYHQWSGSYERGRDDLFTVQNEIARAVVDELKVKLLGEPRPSAALSPNAQARRLYFQSVAALRGGSRKGLHEAMALLRRAVSLDPKFAQAWAALANADLATVVYDDAQVATVRPRALEEADRALAANPNLPEAHVAKARVFMFAITDHAAAVPEIRKTLDVDPNNAAALGMAAQLQLICGRHEESIRLAREVVSRDPLVARSYGELAEKLWMGGQGPEAIQAQLTANALAPGMPYGPFILAVMQLSAGDASSALASAERGSDPEERQIVRPVILDALGRHAEAEREQQAAEKKFGARAPADLAVFYANRGDADRALPLLEQAFRNQDPGNSALHVNPLFAKLRPDPRFQHLLRMHNIPNAALCQQLAAP